MIFRWKGILYILGHGGVRLGLALCGIKVRVAGAEHMPLDRAAVYCANHQSNVDPPILFDALHPRMHIVYKAEIDAIPLLARAFRLGGFVPIDRRNKEAAMRSIEAGAAFDPVGQLVPDLPGRHAQHDRRVSCRSRRAASSWRSRRRRRSCRWRSRVAATRCSAAAGSSGRSRVSIRVGEPIETVGHGHGRSRHADRARSRANRSPAGRRGRCRLTGLMTGAAGLRAGRAQGASARCSPSRSPPRGAGADTRAPPPQPTFRTEANYVRVDVYPTKDGAPVPDLTQDDFEVLEGGAPQTHRAVRARGDSRGRTAGDARRAEHGSRIARRWPSSSRARLFVLFLDTYHVDVGASHAIRKPLVDALDRLIGQDDLVAVMTPEMSASDMTFARRTTTIEGFLTRYWHWGERDRVTPVDPQDQEYGQCYPNEPPTGLGSECTRSERHRRRDDRSPPRKAGARCAAGSRAVSARRARGAQGDSGDHERLAAVSARMTV